MIAEVAMNEDVLRIQRMVAEKKITPEESLELLASLGKDVPSSSAKQNDTANGMSEPAAPKTIREAIIRNMTRRPSIEESASIMHDSKLSAGQVIAFCGACIAVGGVWFTLLLAKGAGLDPLGTTILCASAILGGSGVALVAAYMTLGGESPKGDQKSER
jgi:hypothetical protein